MPEPPGPPWERRWGPPGPWRGPGPHIFRRVIGVFLFVVLVAAAMGAIFATGLAAVSGSGRWVIVGATVVGVVVFGMVARGMFGRTWAPVGDLIDATRRLGEGEQGVRLPARGPGPFLAVSRSFNKMAERLEEEDERRRRFLADIGHELRTPMTVIRGEVEAVLDGLHEPVRLNDVVDEIDLINRLLEDIRLLSMAESGTLRLETEPTDLGALTRSVLASFDHSMGSQSVKSVVEIDDDLPGTDVDPHRIHQVVSNLVANALRQMPDGGQLMVGVSGDSTVARIEVADTGPGIPDDQLDRIFDRFVRSSDSTGTGLGLSISRDLVEAHDGNLTATNRPSGGAVLTVTLPIHR